MTRLSKPVESEIPETKQSDDWTLTTDQMVYMLQHHNAIETAYRVEDMAALKALAASNEFRVLFGAMSWDEAFDRYDSC